MANKNSSWTHEWGKRTYPWKHLVWKHTSFSSQAKTSSCQRHQKQQSARVSGRPQAESIASLCQRAGAQDACCSQGRCHSMCCGNNSWNEWNGGTIKPGLLDFPPLPCSFLCCRAWSDYPSCSQQFSILPQTQKSWASSGPILGCAERAMSACWVKPFRRCICFTPYRPNTKKRTQLNKFKYLYCKHPQLSLQSKLPLESRGRNRHLQGVIYLIWKEMAKIGQFFPLAIKGVAWLAQKRYLQCGCLQFGEMSHISM